MDVLILDDDPVRAKRMIGSLQRARPESRVEVCETGAAFVARLQAGGAASLVSLDHDLRLDDPTDGVQLVRSLIGAWSAHPPFVIVHSSNGDRAQIMLGELELAGWRHERVAAIGEEWVESWWVPAVCRALGGRGRSVEHPA